MRPREIVQTLCYQGAFEDGSLETVLQDLRQDTDTDALRKRMKEVLSGIGLG